MNNKENGRKSPDSGIKRAAKRLVAPVTALVFLAGGAACGPTFNTPLPVDCNTQAGRQLIDCATPTPSVAAGTPKPAEISIVITGSEGKPGQNGESAYQIAVRLDDFKGSEKEWLASLKGKDGAQGETGAQGLQGQKGETGAQGTQGQKGETGATGAQGPVGSKGDKGDLATVAATPTPEAASVNECDPMAITNLPARADASVNGIAVRLEVRDKNNCIRPLFYSETGVGKGQNYVLDLPPGWSVVTASLSAAVHREGGRQVDYTNTPELVIAGPFRGGVGLFEGSFRAVPTEWVNEIAAEVLAIQRQQTRNPNLQITTYTDS